MNSMSERSRRDGQFNDYVTHFPSRDQTVTWPSSVDPWTAATDLDESRGDQVGFDFFFTSGVTRGLPTMVPIAMLYATPEDAANEIAYLYKRHYPISWIEMGEEADGQHMLPEDYGALYLQFATAIHKLVPEAKLGGPALRGNVRRRRGLAGRKRKSLLAGAFCGLSESARATERLHFLLVRALSVSGPAVVFVGRSVSRAGLREPRRASLERQWPAAEHSVLHDRREHWRRGAASTVKSGLWLADYVGTMMTEGAGGTYYFHYMPYPGGGSGFGNFLMIDANYNVVGYPPQYLAAQVITKEWVQPVDAPHKQFKASSDVNDAAGM